MPPLTVLRTKCPECGIMARGIHTEKVYDYTTGLRHRVDHLYCGHQLISDAFKPFRFDMLKTADGDKLYPFQVKACDFGVDANGSGQDRHS
jgi:hypothetical protein